MANDRTKGSVPNVRRAMREGAAGRAERSARLNKRRAGTEGTKLAKRVKRDLNNR